MIVGYKNIKHYLFKYLKLILTFTCFFYFFSIFYENRNFIENVDVRKVLLLVFFLSPLVVFSNLLNVFNWQIITSFYKIKFNRKELISVYFISNFYKYLPGSVGHYLARIYLGNKSNILFSFTLSSIIHESIWFAISGFLVSLLSYNFLFKSFDISIIYSAPLYALIFFDIFLLYIFFLISTFLLNLYNKFFISKKISLFQISLPIVFKICMNYIFYLFIMSFIFYQILGSFFSITEISFLNFLSAVSLSWIIGFILPISPGGIGIREFLLLFLLENYLSISDLTFSVLLFRLITLIGDFISYFIGYLLRD